MKKWMVMGVLLVLLLSFTVVAEEDSCSGFFGTIKCVLFGDPTVRASLAGEAFERNLVGGATGCQSVPGGVMVSNEDFCKDSGKKVGDLCNTQECKQKGGHLVWAMNDAGENVVLKPQPGWSVKTGSESDPVAVKELKVKKGDSLYVDGNGKVYDFKGNEQSSVSNEIKKSRPYIEALPPPENVKGGQLGFFKGDIPYYVKDGKVFTKSDPRTVDSVFNEESKLEFKNGKVVPKEGNVWKNEKDPVQGIVEIPEGTTNIVVTKKGNLVFLGSDGKQVVSGSDYTLENGDKPFDKDKYKAPAAGSSGSGSSSSGGKAVVVAGGGGGVASGGAGVSEKNDGALVEYNNCNGGKSCYVDGKTGVVYVANDKKSEVIKGLKFTLKGYEGKSPFVPDKGYTFADTNKNSVAVQEVKSDASVQYIASDGKVIQLKEESGAVKQWDPAQMKWSDYSDASGKKLSAFVKQQLEAGNPDLKDVGKEKIVEGVRREYAQSVLGDLYSDPKIQIDLDKVYMKTDSPDKNTFVLKGGLGTIEKKETDDKGFNTVEVTINGKEDVPDPANSRTVLMKNGQSMGYQTDEGKEKGEIMIYRGGSEAKPYTLKEKGKNLDSLKNGDELVFTDGAKENPQDTASVQLKDDLYTFTDFETETQTIRDINTHELTKLQGDYYKKGEGSLSEKSECTEDNCFIPTGGTRTEKDGNSVLLNYHYNDITGADRELEKVGIFDAKTGRSLGSEYDTNGDNKPDVRYVMIKEKGELKEGVVVKKVAGNADEEYTLDAKDKKWKDKDKKELTGVELERVKNAHTSSTTRSFQSGLESIYAIENSIKSYPALNKLIFKDIGGATWAEDWQKKADETFAPMLGSNWFPSAICETESRMRDIIPSGKAVIKTSSGTYQTVASIQGERSEQTAPILCSRNTDKDAKEEWVCGEDQICGQDQLCYAADTDGEATGKPIEGYFYTISWAVTAPSDEKMTPLMKSGAAVSFNVVVRETVGSGGTQLYHGKKGEREDAIQLANGAHDRDVITHYSEKELNEVCIVWKNAPMSQVMGSGANWAIGGVGAVAVGGSAIGGGIGAGVVGVGTGAALLTDAPSSLTKDVVKNICAPVVISDKGKVNWESSSKTETSSSTTVSAGKVDKVRNW